MSVHADAQHRASFRTQGSFKGCSAVAQEYNCCYSYDRGCCYPVRTRALSARQKALCCVHLHMHNGLREKQFLSCCGNLPRVSRRPQNLTIYPSFRQLVQPSGQLWQARNFILLSKSHANKAGNRRWHDQKVSFTCPDKEVSLAACVLDRQSFFSGSLVSIVENKVQASHHAAEQGLLGQQCESHVARMAGHGE